MDPSMTWGNHDFLLLTCPANDVLRNPRRDKMRTQVGELDHLLDDIFHLVVSFSPDGREIVECRAIRTRTEVPDLKATFCGFFSRAPRCPEFTTKLF